MAKKLYGAAKKAHEARMRRGGKKKARKSAKRRRVLTKSILKIEISHAGARLGHKGGIVTASERRSGRLGAKHRGRKGAKKRTAKRKTAKRRSTKRKVYRITKGPHKGMRMTYGKNGSRHYYWA